MKAYVRRRLQMLCLPPDETHQDAIVRRARQRTLNRRLDGKCTPRWHVYTAANGHRMRAYVDAHGHQSQWDAQHDESCPCNRWED